LFCLSKFRLHKSVIHTILVSMSCLIMTGSHQARVAYHHNSAPRLLPDPWAVWVTPLEVGPGRLAPTAVDAVLVLSSGLLNAVVAVSGRQMLARW